MKVITWFDNAQFSKFCSYKAVKYIINTTCINKKIYFS
jgi:hypothetical protein